MKKLITFSIIILLSAFLVRSQSFEKNDIVLNAGIGLGRTYGSLGSAWPSLTVTGEMGLWEIGDFGIISVGALMGWQHARYKSVDLNWNDFYIGPRAAFHFTIIPVDKLDVYAGAGLGLRIASEPDWVYTVADGWYYDTATRARFYAGAFAGARYYFAEKIAVFAELGYEVSWFKVGIAFKF